MAPSAWANFKQAVQIALRQFGIAAKLLSKVYETLLAPETCEQEEVGEFKGVTFKIANHKPLWQNWAEPTTRYASRPCTPRSTCVPQSVAHFGTIAINIARSRHKMYPVSSPIGVYGP